MKVIKKINNNVAICRDAQGNELVAFGKGIGFPKTPYKLADLSQITMTFYQLDSHYYQLLMEIPQDILDLSAEIVRMAQAQLRNYLNPNMVFSLADHINFAIKRQSTYKDMKFVFSYDFEQLYPQETELALYAVKLIQKRLLITLPKSEVTAIAMHFVNGQAELEASEEEIDTEQLIERITRLVESTFSIALNTDSFSFSRFAMHLRYYIKRLKIHEQFVDNNEELFITLRDSMPAVYACARTIGTYIEDELGFETTDDELIYLMIHINRLVKNT